MSKLSVIIVNYNVCYFLEQAIRSSLRALEGIDGDIYVVDNESKDNSVEMVREKFPQVKLIANKKNVGFSKANNQAIRLSDAEYVLLLNPDTVVEEDTFSKCIAFMDSHPEAGALGVKMVDGQGVFLPESKRGLPTPAVAFYKISGLAALFPNSTKYGRYHLKYLPENETNEIEILAGAYMFMRKSALDKVGLLDEDYFMYGEDIDLSYRIILGGYKNYYFPETRIIHYKGESTKKSSVNYVFTFYRAMVIFAQKHFSKKNAKLFAFIINVAIYLKASVDIVKNTLQKSLLTILDAGTIFTAMWILKEYWESHFKPTKAEFPSEYTLYVVPIYISIWLLTNYLGGGNDKPYKVSKIVRGALLGTLFISAMSNFLEDFRYSKALILLGGTLTVCFLILNRILFHFMKYRDFRFEKDREKRVALVGSKEESKRIFDLLRDLNLSLNNIGYISITNEKDDSGQKLGYLDDLQDLVSIYKLDELIFCSQDMTATSIIELMMTTKGVEYKIVPNDSDFIIGSNSKNRPGDYYTLELKLNLSEKNQLRNKRVFDVFMCLLNIILFPLFVILVKNKISFVKNIFTVLFGNKTWVGPKAIHGKSNLEFIKDGVLTPYISAYSELDIKTIKRLEMLYAKDYTVLDDVEIYFKSIYFLGN